MQSENNLVNANSYFSLSFTASSSSSLLNPLRPNSDLSQTSHCNIKGLRVSEVMRIENMINSIDILITSLHYFCKKCMETQKENL